MLIIPACRRFANLYGYVRVLRSVEEKWNNEPEWLVSLRENLIEAMKKMIRCILERKYTINTC